MVRHRLGMAEQGLPVVSSGDFSPQTQRGGAALGFTGSALALSPTARPPGWGNVLQTLPSLHFLSELGILQFPVDLRYCFMHN